MKKILLHIGTGKTGTSSIQNSLFYNQRSLREEHGIDYCSEGIEEVFHFGDSIFAHYNLVEWVCKRDTERLNTLFQSIDQSDCDTIIFSCENLYHHLYEEDIKYFSECLKKYEVQIVCYIRRQDLFMESAYKQQVKIGDFKMEFSVFLQKHTTASFLSESHANYYNKLLPWKIYFGLNSLNIRLFDKQSFYKSNLIDDFYHILNVEKPPTTKEENAVNNIALPAELIEVIRFYNTKLLVHKDHQVDFVNFLTLHYDFNDACFLTIDDRKNILSNYEEPNKKLFSEFNIKHPWPPIVDLDTSNSNFYTEFNINRSLPQILYKVWEVDHDDKDLIRQDLSNDFILLIKSYYRFLFSKENKHIRLKLSLFKSNLFSATYYLEVNQDVKDGNRCPYDHYIKYGWKEKRRPGPNISTDLIRTIAISTDLKGKHNLYNFIS